MLIKLGEQVSGLRRDVNHHAEYDEEIYRKIEASLRGIRTDLATSLKEQRADLEKKYVTKVEFSPTRMISYGLVALIVMSVVTALISIVVSGKVHTP